MRILSEQARDYGQRCWQVREPLWQKRREYRETRARLTGEEGELFAFLAGTLPVTDLGDYEPELLVSHIREALSAREAFPWCADLPEEHFLLWVLCPRVNNEALCDCRGLFRRELAPLVEGLGPEEAILAVNRWCGSQVSYRSTDETTSSALDIYRRGWGRCGEESVFAVNALRSVGIAARQVYAPWWSHCDDNHAWVEAWDGGRWRFLGACEPEPRLDRGWFTCAAGRAMLCHVKAFVGEGRGWEKLFPGVTPLDLDRRQGVAYESVTARYGLVRPFSIRVAGEDGAPAENVPVSLSVLNEGALRPIAWRRTDKQGLVRLNLGLGSLWVTAWKGGCPAEALVHTGETEEIVLTLGAGRVEQGSFAFSAPPDRGILPPPLSREEKARRREELEAAQSAREKRQARAPALREEFPGLTEKDRAGDIDPRVLEECPPRTEDLSPWLASPRMGWEPLAPWRELLKGAMPAKPEKLWDWLRENIPAADSFPDLPQTPAGVWRLGRGDEAGRGALFCALCRANGIPARLGADGLPEFWRGGRFHRADGAPEGTVIVRLSPGQSGGWSLARLEDGRVLRIPPEAETLLPAGNYRLLASTRLPDGGQLGYSETVFLPAGGRVELRPRFPDSGGQGLFQRLPLPELGFACPGLSLLCWVRPGEEPTEHLFNELGPVWRKLAELGCKVHIICEEPEKLPPLPGAEIHPWDGEAAEAAARRVYLEPERLPLAVLAEEGAARYACAGYHVGAGELIARLAGLLASQSS